MTVEIPRLGAFVRALTDTEGSAVEVEHAVRLAGNAVRRRVRAKAPRAKGLPPNSRYNSGTPRKRGDLARAVGVRNEGTGWDAKSTIKAGGVAPIVVKGSVAHEIDTKTARALSFSAAFTVAGPARRMPGVVAFGSVQHPAVGARPFVAQGIEEARPDVDQIMSETGQRIVTQIVERTRR